jgi:metal transporter CNNM
MARASASSSPAGGLANGISSFPHARINTLLLCLLHAFAPLVKALPVVQRAVQTFEEVGPKDPKDARLWIYLSTAFALVVAGGAFAGLTIA